MTTLGSALEAFIREHEYCGELDNRLRGGSHVDDVHGEADDRLGRSMTNGRGRLRALVVAHHRKSRAERVIGVEPSLATRLAPHGRVEGAIEDGPGPISGWGDQNPKGQPQAHSRSALVAPMLANPSTPLRKRWPIMLLRDNAVKMQGTSQ